MIFFALRNNDGVIKHLESVTATYMYMYNLAYETAKCECPDNLESH